MVVYSLSPLVLFFPRASKLLILTVLLLIDLIELTTLEIITAASAH